MARVDKRTNDSKTLRSWLQMEEADVDDLELSSKRHKTVVKYDSSYVKFKFSWSGTKEEPRPWVCPVCRI